MITQTLLPFAPYTHYYIDKCGIIPVTHVLEFSKTWTIDVPVEPIPETQEILELSKVYAASVSVGIDLEYDSLNDLIFGGVE
jgi:hypothetical protein